MLISIVALTLKLISSSLNSFQKSEINLNFVDTQNLHQCHSASTFTMSALFNFQSLLLVILLLICTSTYLHAQIPAVMDRNKHGYLLPQAWIWRIARLI